MSKQNNINSDFDDLEFQNITEQDLLSANEENMGGKKKPKHHRSKKKKIFLSILFTILAILLAIVITIVVSILIGKYNLLNHDNENLNIASAVDNAYSDDGGMTIEYNGETYFFNKKITTILCMGIDTNEFSNKETYGTNGQADAIFMVAFDTKTGKTTIIPIPRDAMVDIDLYSSSGKYITSKKEQICLSYAYGDGKKTSCENTAKSVSRLLYGIPVDSYAAINMDAIPVLTDTVGGVNITMPEDLTLLNKSYSKGENVTLSGTLAEVFLRIRDHSNVNSNSIRMQHQKLFVQSFINSAINMSLKDITVPINIYKSLSPYMVTNLDITDVSFFATNFLTTRFLGSKKNRSIQYASIEGNMTLLDDYAVFNVDNVSLFETLLNVFYIKKVTD